MGAHQHPSINKTKLESEVVTLKWLSYCLVFVEGLLHRLFKAYWKTYLIVYMVIDVVTVYVHDILMVEKKVVTLLCS